MSSRDTALTISELTELVIELLAKRKYVEAVDVIKMIKTHAANIMKDLS